MDYIDPKLRSLHVTASDFKRKALDSELKRGDVISVNRNGIYDHYGIYTGNLSVIHFANEGSDFGGDICVRRATLAQFKKEADYVSVIDFEQFSNYINTPRIKQLNLELALWDLYDSVVGRKLNIFSPEETVRRAESQLGMRGYNIAFNNCEHFAFWCKTGKHASSQTENVITALVKGLYYN